MAHLSRRLLILAPLLMGALGFAGATLTGTAAAEVDDKSAANERCATRLAITFLGTSPTPQMLTAGHPQDLVDVLVEAPAFIERFSRFVNTSFNNGSASAPEQDAPYFLVRHVLASRKPWSDVFLGRYSVDVVTGQGVQVRSDENGLGYFRSAPWQRRYAGNEAAGLKIQTAYRIMQNTVGLELVATTNAPDADISAAGRSGAACKSCHFDNWYALDKVAGVLSKKVVDDKGNVAFAPYSGPPQQILGGQSIADDEELVRALVASENFSFQTCRLAFEFLYGRAENTCEGPIFDQCVDAFKEKGTMQAALVTVAKNPGFCQ